MSATNGTYSLSSGGLSANEQYVGYNGKGTFTQSGGTNSIAGGALVLGYNSGSSGTYNLNGGLLILSSFSQGDGSSAFNFSGGTLQASAGFSTSQSMTLYGAATLDLSGGTVTLAGTLRAPAAFSRSVTAI